MKQRNIGSVGASNSSSNSIQRKGFVGGKSSKQGISKKTKWTIFLPIVVAVSLIVFHLSQQQDLNDPEAVAQRTMDRPTKIRQTKKQQIIQPAPVDGSSVAAIASTSAENHQQEEVYNDAQKQQRRQQQAEKENHLIQQQQKQQQEEEKFGLPPSYIDKIIKLNENTTSSSLVSSLHTIVTAYFKIPSKHSSDKYDGWMGNMLSLEDPMVIFTSKEMVPKITEHRRKHALNATVLIVMELDKLPLASNRTLEFWNHQLDIDPEKKIHSSYYVFWIWLSKSWFVNEVALRQNFFGSEIFLWSDIGCFRNRQYNQKYLLQHPENIPRHATLQMAHHVPKAPPFAYWNDKLSRNGKTMFYHSGSQMIAYRDVWKRFHDEFLVTIEGYLRRNMFIGEDQTILQTTCLRNPDLCQYVPFNTIKDNHYFGLRYVLYNRGNFTYWKPPTDVPLDAK